MGTEEESIPAARPSKPTASIQEMPTIPAYPDWSNPMQAYYGSGATPHPFFATTVASPTPHPYMWGGQHTLMSPYGTPVPYQVIYPHGGVYAHPNMAMTPSSVPNNGDHLEKSANHKDQVATENSKSTANKVGETGKAASGSGKDAGSQSGDSGSEGTSDGSDENNQQQPAAGKKGSFQQMLADANAQSKTTEDLVSGKPVTTLNIGMDLWNGSPAAAGAAKMRPNTSGAAAGVMSDQWIQDDHELKRQKRKQSNRESARRSRLRKQAECEEIQARVASLANENCSLKGELMKLSAECKKLASENSSIKEELMRICGPNAVVKVEQDQPSAVL